MPIGMLWRFLGLGWPQGCPFGTEGFVNVSRLPRNEFHGSRKFGKRGPSSVSLSDRHYLVLWGMD
eukprot:1180101-Pyramimonas_sp.AAC.1